MHETISTSEGRIRPQISIATYAAIAATVLIMVLSAITFAATSGDGPARASYDPSVVLVGFAD